MSVSSPNGPHPIPTTTPFPTRRPHRSTHAPLQNHPITPSTDSTSLCPICKDQFTLNEIANILPCTHFYHSQCILPWLQINSSCPVCRFNLSSSEEEDSLLLDESYVAFVNQHMERVRTSFRENEIVNIDDHDVELSRDWGVGSLDRPVLVDSDYGDWNVRKVNDQDYESWVCSSSNTSTSSNSRSRVYVCEEEDVDVDNTPAS